MARSVAEKNASHLSMGSTTSDMAAECSRRCGSVGSEQNQNDTAKSSAL